MAQRFSARRHARFGACETFTGTTTPRRSALACQGAVVVWLIGTSIATSGCAVVSVAGTAVSVAGSAAGAAVSVGGAVVGSTVRVAGKVAEKTVDLAVPSGSAAPAR